MSFRTVKDVISSYHWESDNYKKICIRDNYCDYYIGRLDGKTESEQYRKLLPFEVVGINYNTTAISGSAKVYIDVEIVIKDVEINDDGSMVL